MWLNTGARKAAKVKETSYRFGNKFIDEEVTCQRKEFTFIYSKGEKYLDCSVAPHTLRGTVNTVSSSNKHNDVTT